MKPLAGVLLLLAALPLLLRAADPPPPGERWARLAVGNVTVYSNAGDRAARAAAENFLRFRAALTQVSGLAVQSPLPTYIYVFQNETSFAPYRRAAVGKEHDDVIGVFTEHGGANWTLMQAKSDVGFDRVIYHELTHYFLRNTLPGVPPWLHEGMAGFYETLRPMGMSNTVTIGNPPPLYLEALRDSGLMPLREIFTFRPPLEHHSHDLRVAQFYRESWLLMHYLMIGNPSRGAALGPFLEALDAGQPLAAAFQTAFHASLEDVDKELGGYLRRGRFNAMQYEVPVAKSSVGDPAPLPRDQLLAALGELLVHTNPADGAEAFLGEALKLNPNNGAALADLAAVKEAAGKPGDGDALYEKAIVVAGNDVRPYLGYSVSRVARMQALARDGESVPRADIEKCRALAARALQIAPDDIRANAVLGATYGFAGEEAKKGIASSAKSFRLAPSRNDVAADLVLLYARADQPALAKAMIDRVLLPSGDEVHLAEATENLALAEYIRATEMRGKPGARPLLEHARNRTQNPKLRKKIDALLAQ